MNRYATLDLTLQELSNDKTIGTAALDTRQFVWQALGFVSERIEQMTDDEFAPHVDTRYFNARGRHILGSVMDVVEGQHNSKTRSPLGEITSISLDGGSAVSSANYRGDPRGQTPIRRIAFTSTDSWLTYATGWRAVHAIAGVWVNRSRYSSAWVDSGDTVENNPLTASGVTINVNDADALSGTYALPRFQAGQLIRIGTGTDYRIVEAVAGGVTNTLTVIPNANGGTGASQAQNTAIYIWEPEPVIQRATLKWAQHLFSRRGVTTSSTYDGVAGIKFDFPPDAPQEVLNILVEGGYLDKDCLPVQGKAGVNG